MNSAGFEDSKNRFVDCLALYRQLAPIKRKIIDKYAIGFETQDDIAIELNCSQPNISKHINQIRRKVYQLQMDKAINNLCSNLSKSYRILKLEYNDLVQQAWVYYLIIGKLQNRINKYHNKPKVIFTNEFMLKRIELKLKKYIDRWDSDPISEAVSLEYLLGN